MKQLKTLEVEEVGNMCFEPSFLMICAFDSCRRRCLDDGAVIVAVC